MSAYVRLIIGEKGKVLSVVKDSLYHPNEQTLDFIEELLMYGGSSIEQIDESIEDSNVLILFNPHTYPSHHPLDPVEYETDLAIEQVIVLQTGYKEFWRRQIEQYVKDFQGCSTPPSEIENSIGEWEELYGEDFYNEEDPFDVYKHEWTNSFTA